MQKSALQLNFVQEIVEPSEQLKRALEIAQQIVGQAPLVVRQTIISVRLAVDEGSAAAVALCKDI